MLSNAMGLILADHDRVQLGDLSKPRALAAIPFGGRYRIIDFMLSSMVNSGVKNVGILAQQKYRSLLDHTQTGASWDLDRMSQGLSILPPYINSSYFDRESGDLSGLYDFVAWSKQKYVILADSNIIVNIDFEEVIAQHEAKKADMSILYNQDGQRFGAPRFSLELERGRLKDFLVDAADPGTTRSAIGIMIMERELLLTILSQAMARGQNNFSIEILLKMHEKYQIRGIEYKDICLRINDIASYFKNSMRLLEREVRDHFFNTPERPIYTKVKNEAPAMYAQGSFLSNSLLSDGCEVYGACKDSVIFRGVRISRKAKVEHCILSQDAIVGEGAELTHVILDKGAAVRPGVRLQGQADFPVVIGKGAIV